MKKTSNQKSKSRKIIIRVLIVAVLAAAAFFVYKKMTPAQETEEVMTTQAVIGNVESVITGNGTLNPANQYEVKSLVKGSILQAPFEEGSIVDKGELLYQISTGDIDNNIKSSEISLEKVQNDYDALLSKQKKLKLSVKEGGYIKTLYVKEGDTIQSGKTIADIYSEKILYLDLLFPSGEVTKDFIGKTALVTLDATDETAKGEVTEISSMEETMDGGILGKKVTLRIKNKGGLKSGDSAEASIDGIMSINSGTFRPETQYSLMAEADGVIASLSYKAGQWIDADAVLLTLSSEDLDRQIESAKLSIKEAELSLDTQKTQENLYQIKSPITGQVITKNKKQGDTIDPTTDTQSGPMAIIYDLTYLTFQMNIDELQISSIKEGQKVSITTEALPDTSFDGIIDRISLKGNTNNGVTSYPVIVKVTDFGQLLPGMNVKGSIIIDKADNVLTIPSSALQAGNIVYVASAEAPVTEDASIPKGFKAVEVTIGINDGTNVEILSGINEGDSVYIPFDDTVESTYGMYEE